MIKEHVWKKNFFRRKMIKEHFVKKIQTYNRFLITKAFWNDLGDKVEMIKEHFGKKISNALE